VTPRVRVRRAAAARAQGFDCADARPDAEALLPPQYLDCLQHIDQPFFTPVYDFCSPTLVFGRVALVGDAASAPRPHIGFGVSKAGAEAQALAEALSNYDNIDRALAAYNAVRQPLSERIVSHARKLGMQLRPPRSATGRLTASAGGRADNSLG
jgi:2-polyprenyl-6-methoxyphenol hydroxylase-like FAD-dependent oxidoreductase